MIKRMELFIIAALFLLITAVILIIYSKQREHEFQAHNTSIQKNLVNGASYALNLKLLEKKRHVLLFASEYTSSLIQLNNNPNDEAAENNIKTRLQQRFSDFFTYTITDQNGVPRLLNIDSLVGHACQLDLSKFAKKIGNSNQYQNKVVIHPQPFNYHYDIMSPLFVTGSKPGIFFVSFHPKEIADILKTHEIRGQQLLLVKQSDPDLIEIGSKGARDKLKRDIRLSKEEQQRILVEKNIPGTDWRLVNLPDSSYEKAYIAGLWKEAAIIIGIVTLALFLLLSILLRRRPQ